MTPHETKTPPKKNGESTTRDAILEAALDLFALRGYHATSMREIAAKVPIRAAGIYYWFANKESILLELERCFLDDLNSTVIDAVSRHKNPATRLAAAVREHVRYHGLFPRAAFVTDSELRALSSKDRLEIQAKRDAYQAMFISYIDDGVSADVFKASDVKVVSYAILLECTGVAIWFTPNGARTLEEVAEIHIELVLGSLMTPRATITKAIRDTRSTLAQSAPQQ